MNLTEIKEEIVNFYDYNDNQKEEILKKVLKIASENNKDEFITELRNLFPQYGFSGIGVIYEALTKEPEKWDAFFVEEYERTFKDAEDFKDPGKSLDTLAEIGLMESVKYDFAHDIIRVLSNYISHENAEIQFFAISYLGDWLVDDNAKQHLPLIKALQTIQLENIKYRIRYITYESLWLCNQLSSKNKLSFIDKIRAKLFKLF